VDEVGVNAETGRVLVRIDPRYFRPTEVEFLLGNPAKAERMLGWKAAIPLTELISEMVREDLREAERDNLCRAGGFPTYEKNE
jgi:GDPmannose 4,6-dehydratase